MPGPFVLALDIGTSSVRASVYDAQLRARRTARVPYRWNEYPDGRVELDAARLERLTADAIDGALQGQRMPIAAVGTAAFWHSLVGLDSRGGPVTPVIPWSDVRAATEALRLQRLLAERRVHARTGCRLHASYWPARLRWFARHDRRTFRRVRRWASFSEVLESRWLGRDGVSLSQASGTGMFAQRRCEWDQGMLRATAIGEDSVAPLIDIDDTSAVLAARWRRRWPALAGARWLPAVGDGALNNMGAGCVAKGRAALMIGTSGAMRMLWEPAAGDRPRQPFGLWRYRLDRRRIVIGGALSNGGNVREWLLRTLATGRGTDRRAVALAPDSHGIDMLPFFAGTRSPDYLDAATGVVAGLTFATRPEHLLRAAMDAIGYRFARVLEELQRTVRVRDIVAAGGALERSAGWTQILADILDRPITLCAERELTSRGAAVLALEQMGELDVSRLPPPRGRVIRPSPDRHRLYAEGLRRHNALVRTMHGV